MATTIKEGSRVIGQVHEMGMVSTGDGRSVLRVQLLSPFMCPETETASGFVVPCKQPPVSGLHSRNLKIFFYPRSPGH